MPVDQPVQNRPEPISPFKIVSRRPAQIRLSEVDRALLVARLLRVTTDLLVLAGDVAVPKDERDKLRLAATVVGEVNLPR